MESPNKWDHHCIKGSGAYINKLLPSEHTFAATKFMRTTIIETGMDVIYVNTGNKIYMNVIHPIPQLDRLLELYIACSKFESGPISNERPPIMPIEKNITSPKNIVSQIARCGETPGCLRFIQEGIVSANAKLNRTAPKFYNSLTYHL